MVKFFQCIPYVEVQQQTILNVTTYIVYLSPKHKWYKTAFGLHNIHLYFESKVEHALSFSEGPVENLINSI